MNARATLKLATLSIVSTACLIATPATADLACQARASLSPDGPLRVDFEALSANGSGAIGFLWNFGDGSSSTEQSPSHDYASPNIYHATLTVTDTGVLQQTCRDTFEVAVGVVIDPNCWGTASTRWGVAPLGVQFDAHGAFISDPPPYRCTWSFGDGDTSALCSPYHVYSLGTYWAVFTFYTSVRSYQCSTLRITAFDAPTPVRKTRWGRLKQLYR